MHLCKLTKAWSFTTFASLTLKSAICFTFHSYQMLLLIICGCNYFDEFLSTAFMVQSLGRFLLSFFMHPFAKLKCILCSDICKSWHYPSRILYDAAASDVLYLSASFYRRLSLVFWRCSRGTILASILRSYYCKCWC